MTVNQAPLISMKIPTIIFAEYLCIQGKWVPYFGETTGGVRLQQDIVKNKSHRKIGAMTSVMVASIFMRT